MKFGAMRWLGVNLALSLTLGVVLLALGFEPLAWGASAESDLSSVAGLWTSFDDNTHEPSAQIRVILDPKDGLIGRIEKVLDPKASPG